MSRDAVILFTSIANKVPENLTTNDITPNYPVLLPKFEVAYNTPNTRVISDELRPADQKNNQKIVFEIVTPYLFWMPEYPKGPWPEISAILLSLLGHKNIEQVWYGSDDLGVIEINTHVLFRIHQAYLGLDKGLITLWDAE